MKNWVRLCLIGIAALGAWLVFAGAAMAADHIVDCTLHPYAMTAAIRNAAAGDRLLVNGRCVGTYEIGKGLTLRGNPRATFDGAGVWTVFSIHRFKKVKFSHVTIIGGHATVGGGIFSGNPSLVVFDHTTVRGNFASSDGGGMKIGGALRMRDSTVSANRSGFIGGGISVGGISDHDYSVDGSVSIINSTISGNYARESGGGLEVDDNPLTVRLTTISNNSTDANSGGAGGLEWLGPHLARGVFSGSIIAGNRGGAFGFPDCLVYASGAVISGGFNIAGSSCDFAAEGDLVRDGDLASFGLGPLGWNGGITQTMPLLPDSPAVDRIPVGSGAPGGHALCPQVDQRGVARPQGQACDSGAYELIP